MENILREIQSRVLKDEQEKESIPSSETKTNDDASKIVSSFVTTINNKGKVLNTFAPVSNSTWIIDSDATYHMIVDFRHLSRLKCSLQQNFFLLPTVTQPKLLGKDP